MAGLTKIVFVGNLPYSHSDDLQKQLEQVFATVGPVSNFRIAFEKELANRADLDSANTLIPRLQIRLYETFKGSRLEDVH
ncbi:hypothetical protein KEM48_001532 [Puccinia striiformis f. sp. tritici PST-130]|nr:hypothetical protein KEM48_001532 [Puccinia striiformis f. sp. tritici PST-130]